MGIPLHSDADDSPDGHIPRTLWHQDFGQITLLHYV